MMNEIREIVKKEHQKGDYKYHVSIVVKDALKLAEMKKADKEIVEMAALMHDLGRTHGLKPGHENEHHIRSAKMAEKILNDLNCPEDKANKVIGCILSHRGAKDDYPPKTLEERIVANADAMAHFDCFLDLFSQFVSMVGLEEAVKVIDDKIERDWNKKLTMSEAKEMVKDKYKAVRLLIDSIKESI